jgi:hypothetical protein
MLLLASPSTISIFFSRKSNFRSDIIAGSSDLDKNSFESKEEILALLFKISDSYLLLE